MGRRSLKAERVEEILEAFYQCLKEYGFEGTTLDKIGEKAGLARRMILHYIGRKEDVIEAAVIKISNRFRISALEFIDSSNKEKRLDAGLDFLFSDDFNQHPDAKLVAALLPTSLHDDKVKAAVQKIYDFFVSQLLIELRTEYPNNDEVKLREIAFNIVCLSFGGGWMSNIGVCSDLNTKSVVYRLLEDLNED